MNFEVEQLNSLAAGWIDFNFKLKFKPLALQPEWAMPVCIGDSVSEPSSSAERVEIQVELEVEALSSGLKLQQDFK